MSAFALPKLNPFALAKRAKAARNRIHAEALKCELNARHDAAAMEESLSESAEPLPPGAEQDSDALARYGRRLPDDVRERVLVADGLARGLGIPSVATAAASAGKRLPIWITNGSKLPRRTHKRTGKKSKGRPGKDDVGLGSAAQNLLDYLKARTASDMTESDAIRVIAKWIARVDGITDKNARERIYRAQKREQ